MNKDSLIVIILFLFFGNVYPQNGCTDILATNYDPNAIQNDGSCTYNPETISVTDTYLLDGVLAETSGLIYWNNLLWTQNDSGDTTLYALNPSDGSIAGNISLFPETNTDWEEISQDQDYIYVGDFGNNTQGNRTDLRIIKVSKNSILSGNPEMELINFSYEDQVDFTPQAPNHTDYDCEAFIIAEDDIFLFTKEWVSGKTRVYKLPKTAGTHQAEFVDYFDIQGLVTGAVYKESTGLIALSGYSNLLQPFIFLLYDFDEMDFFGGNKRKLMVDLPFHQVEGITTEDGLNFFLSSERFEPMGMIQQLHTVDLHAYLGGQLSVVPLRNSVRYKIYPNPTKSTIQIHDVNNQFPIKYSILNMASKIVGKGILTLQDSSIDFSNLPSGSYILRLEERDSLKVIRK